MLLRKIVEHRFIHTAINSFAQSEPLHGQFCYFAYLKSTWVWSPVVNSLIKTKIVVFLVCEFYYFFAKKLLGIGFLKIKRVEILITTLVIRLKSSHHDTVCYQSNAVFALNFAS